MLHIEIGPMLQPISGWSRNVYKYIKCLLSNRCMFSINVEPGLVRHFDGKCVNGQALLRRTDFKHHSRQPFRWWRHLDAAGAFSFNRVPMYGRRRQHGSVYIHGRCSAATCTGNKARVAVTRSGGTGDGYRCWDYKEASSKSTVDSHFDEQFLWPY